MKYRIIIVISLLSFSILITGFGLRKSSNNSQQISITSSPAAPSHSVIMVDNISHLTKIVSFTLADRVMALEWTPDRQKLVVSTMLPNALWLWTANEFDAVPQQIDGTPLNLVHELQLHSSLPLLLGLRSDKVLLWNMEDHTEQVVWEIEEYEQIYGANISPKGDLIAVIDTHQARILDVDTFDVRWTLDLVNSLEMDEANYTFVGQGIVFHPDGQSVFIADKLLDKIYWWDFGNNEYTVIYEGTPTNFDASIVQLLVDPSNQWLAKSGRGNTFISLWDIQAEQFSGNLQGHLINDGAITGMTFNIDSTLLVAGAFDGTIEFWDVTSGESLQVIKVNDDAIWSVAISPDGTLLATGGENGTLTIWAVDPAATSRD